MKLARARRCRALTSADVAWGRVPRQFEGVNSSEPQQVANSTLENHCLLGELTFGDPFQDSGVES